jgi:hypothetical protein
MRSVKRPSKVLRGLSFEISDLILIKDRSEAHDLRMVVQLDYGSDVEEYEEVLAFYSATSPQLQWMMWRNACAVFVRSIDGRGGRYRSAAQAIEALVRKAGAVLTNIKATQTQPLEAVRPLQADLNVNPTIQIFVTGSPIRIE